jgi:molecular chaperone HscB
VNGHHHHITSCWNCGKSTEEIHFCDSCNSLQPPTTNYYDFFGLDHGLDVDLRELEKRFYMLSRRLHPDVYFRRSPQERQYSLDATAILNDAYRTLKDPVARAEYLLKENGFDIGEQKSTNVPPELLEEVFELNMALEELREGDEDARPQLEQAREKFLAMRDELDAEMNAVFREYDRSRDFGALARLRGILNRRTYIRNLVNEVEKELLGAADRR